MAKRKSPTARTYLVGGLKGGTGKSTFALNLAVWLAKKDRNVLLADTDEQGSPCSNRLPSGAASTTMLKSAQESQTEMVRESQYLYIVKHAIEPLVKVGIAVDPHKRISEIESDFGEIDRSQSWVLIGPYRYISRAERAIHITFDRWRRAGAAGNGMGATEWFADDCFSDLLAHVRKFFEAEDRGYVVLPFYNVAHHCVKAPRVVVPDPPKRIRPQKPMLPTDFECAELSDRFEAIYRNTVDRFGIYRFTFEESDWLFSRIEGDHPDYEGGIDPWNDALRLHFRIPRRESWCSFISSHYTDFENKSQFGAYCIEGFYDLSEQNDHPSLARYASSIIRKIEGLPKGEVPTELINIKSDQTLDPWMNAFCSMASSATDLGERML